MAFTAFASTFIFARVFFGHLPDQLGGARVALYSIFIEAAGQAWIGYANEPPLALAGALLTGLGYSLIYPGLGIEAVRRTPPDRRGLAMGTYTAFLDLTRSWTRRGVPCQCDRRPIRLGDRMAADARASAQLIYLRAVRAVPHY